MQSWQFQGDLLTHTGGDWEQGLGHYMQCKYIYACFSLTPPSRFVPDYVFNHLYGFFWLGSSGVWIPDVLLWCPSNGK